MRKYGLQGDNRLHYGNIPFIHKYDRSVFLGLLVDEYSLRMNVQEQERIQRRIDGLRSLETVEREYEDEEWADIEDIEMEDDLSPLLRDSYSTDRTEQIGSSSVTFEKAKSHEKGIKILKQKLSDVKSQHAHLSRTIYEYESMLPSPVKKTYESLRKNPKWYMREELITDCKGRDGCCSRGCGCCALRASHSYKKGVGHCTVECICCVRYRGFRPSMEEKKNVLKAMTMLFRCDAATYFLKMVNGYFSKS